MTSQIKSYSVINKLTDSAVKMSRRLTADVDAWAEAHDTVRSDAIRRLVELGVKFYVIRQSRWRRSARS